jgi:hypothetical protein
MKQVRFISGYPNSSIEYILRVSVSIKMFRPHV